MPSVAVPDSHTHQSAVAVCLGTPNGACVLVGRAMIRFIHPRDASWM